MSLQINNRLMGQLSFKTNAPPYDAYAIRMVKQVRLVFWLLFTDLECIQGRTKDSNFQGGRGGGGQVFFGDGAFLRLI